MSQGPAIQNRATIYFKFHRSPLALIGSAPNCAIESGTAMTISLFLGVSFVAAALAIPIALRGRPYSASIARFVCGLWVVALVNLTSWVWGAFEEGFARTALAVPGALLAIAALLQMFKDETHA
jgi:hypothetical protein